VARIISGGCSTEMCRQISRLSDQKVFAPSYVKLAAKYGMTKNMIWFICTRQYWTHLPEED
jgi:hypothetical protein